MKQKLIFLTLFLFGTISTVAIVDIADKSKSQTESDNSAATTLKYNKKTISLQNSNPNNKGHFSGNFSLQKQIMNMLQRDPGLSKKAQKIKITIINDEILIRGIVKSIDEMNYVFRQISEMAPEYLIHNEVQILKK